MINQKHAPLHFKACGSRRRGPWRELRWTREHSGGEPALRQAGRPSASLRTSRTPHGPCGMGGGEPSKGAGHDISCPYEEEPTKRGLCEWMTSRQEIMPGTACCAPTKTPMRNRDDGASRAKADSSCTKNTHATNQRVRHPLHPGGAKRGPWTARPERLRRGKIVGPLRSG